MRYSVGLSWSQNYDLQNYIGFNVYQQKYLKRVTSTNKYAIEWKSKYFGQRYITSIGTEAQFRISPLNHVVPLALPTRVSFSATPDGFRLFSVGATTNNWDAIDNFRFTTSSDLLGPFTGNSGAIVFPRKTRPRVKIGISNIYNSLTLSLPPKYFLRQFTEPLALKLAFRKEDTVVSAIVNYHPLSYARSSVILGIHQRATAGVVIYFNCTLRPSTSAQFNGGVSLGVNKQF